MDDVSTSGPVDGQFISESEIRTTYEAVPYRGYSLLLKASRQGRWFMLKGLKPECWGKAVYLELLKKEYALMAQFDHPNVVKVFAKAQVAGVNGVLLLPDGWNPSVWPLNSVNVNSAGYEANRLVRDAGE